MNSFPMQLLGDLVAIRPEEIKQTILLPDWQRALKGFVIATGPGKMLTNGSIAPMDLQAGDYVSFGATSGMESMFNGANIRIMRESDVDMVIEFKRDVDIIAQLKGEIA